jgi:transcriptional regulator with XRE-family HTH domain
LREARAAKDISQKRLGILAGMDEFTASARINQYERDKHVPDFSIVRRLARALGIPVVYLYTEDDDLAELLLSYAQASRRRRAQVKRLLKSG